MSNMQIQIWPALRQLIHTPTIPASASAHTLRRKPRAHRISRHVTPKVHELICRRAETGWCQCRYLEAVAEIRRGCCSKGQRKDCSR